MSALDRDVDQDNRDNYALAIAKKREQWLVENVPGVKRARVIGDCELLQGDCLEVMPGLGPVDLVHTDPPWGVGNFVQTSGRVCGRGTHKGVAVDWNEAGPPPEFFSALREMSRHRIIWGANFFNCFEPFGGAILWDKCQPMPNFSKADIASCTHYKKTEVVRVPWTNFTATHRAESDHPCERPVDLYLWALQYIPGVHLTTFDAFIGSGTTLVACAKLGRRGIGIEIDPDYFDTACKRVEEAYRQPDLFVAPPLPPVQEGFDL